MTRLWGLQTRLLTAFAALVILTAVAVAGGMYVQARTEILQRSQNAAVNALLIDLESTLPLPSMPPTNRELASLTEHLAERNSNVAVNYGDRWIGPSDRSLITPELRAVVREGRVAWQRVEKDGMAMLVIGTRVGGTQLEVYTAQNLIAEQASVSALAHRARVIASVALVMAMLLALLTAQGVLRPVRDLRQAAAKLGEGDLTARVTVQGSDELADVATTFNSTAEALQNHVGELRRMESEARRFVADVSHELRTPLAAMAAVTGVLDEEEETLSPDVAEAARLVSQETRNLTHLVNDLIEITRFDSGRATLVTDEINVPDALLATLRTRGWATEVEAELPETVVAQLDKRRLDVIVANLVGNALTHGAPPVTLALGEDEDTITITVTDEGPGLPPEVLPNVFNRFYKADTARTRSAGSSGLGLAIARENAHLHGGTLTAAGREEGGAVFTLRLPKRRPQ